MCFYELLQIGQICLKNSNVILQLTIFEYAVGSCITNLNPDNYDTSCGLICKAEQELRKVFDIETIGIRDDPSCNDEDKALENFKVKNFM